MSGMCGHLNFYYSAMENGKDQVTFLPSSPKGNSAQIQLMGFGQEGAGENVGKEGNMTLCVQLFGLIQRTVAVPTSEYLVGNKMLHACTSGSTKCQSEFSQLGRTGCGKVLVPLGLYSYNDLFELQV